MVDRASSGSQFGDQEGFDDVFDQRLMAQWRPINQTVAELRNLNLSDNIKSSFPSVCICGSQSSGKSSLVETIIGLQCLPKGQGTVTKRPTELYIINDPEHHNPQFSVADKLGAQEKICRNKQDFQSTIVKLNNKCDDIIREPIIAKIRWAKGFDFTVTDLPGIIAIDNKGNQKVGDLTQQITKAYIERDNVIIVCVIPAHTDENTSEAYKLVKMVDKDFDRTIFVRTKFDLLLNDPGKSIETPLKIGNRINKKTFLTINRSTKDNEDKLSIRECFNNERKVKNLDPDELSKRYPPLLTDQRLRSEMKTYSEQIGIDRLLKSIINVFSMKMRTNQPEIMRKLLMQRDQFNNQLKQLPPPIDENNKQTLFNRYCDEMVEEFLHLCSGDRIKYYMAIEPFIRQKSGQKYNDEKVFLASKVNGHIVDMLLLYFEACGMQPRQTYVSEPFLKKCVLQVLEESKNLTDRMFVDVHKHIMDVIGELLNKSLFNRGIQQRLQKDLRNSIEGFKVRTSDLIQRLFDCETAFPFWDPDHFDDQKEEPKMRFTYRKDDVGKEEACIITKDALYVKFEDNLGCSISDPKSTKVIGQEVMDAGQVGNPGDILVEYDQAKLRTHLLAEFEKRRMQNKQIDFYLSNRIIQPLLEKVETQLDDILDTFLKSYTYCYYIISQRKNFLASLLCKDFLEQIKKQFFKIVHNKEYIKDMGDEPEVLDLRNRLQDRLEAVQMAIDKVSEAFNKLGHQILD